VFLRLALGSLQKIFGATITWKFVGFRVKYTFHWCLTYVGFDLTKPTTFALNLSAYMGK